MYAGGILLSMVIFQMYYLNKNMSLSLPSLSATYAALLSVKSLYTYILCVNQITKLQLDYPWTSKAKDCILRC
jgi:hypothetical protein